MLPSPTRGVPGAPRRVLGITSTRSDYDLLSGVYRALHADPGADFALVVGGAHLSSTFGGSIDGIVRDGLPVAARIECLLDSNSAAGRVKSAAIFLQSLVDVLAVHRPDVVLFAGDREDALAAATACAYLSVPSVHFFGGDHASDGHVDNPVRHAISKLATVHFVAHPQHAERLARLGEEAERVHLIGSPAVDKFLDEPDLAPAQVAVALGPGAPLPAGEYAVLIHHAIGGRESVAAEEASYVLDVLAGRGMLVYVSVPNPDPGCRELLAVYERRRDDPGVHFYRSLERAPFVNLLRRARLLVGNSSAGLLEAPSVPLAAVNVGERQRGRLAAANVIFVDGTPEAIGLGVDTALSPEWRAGLAGLRNPYGDGRSVPRAAELILGLDFGPLRRKRHDPLTPVPGTQ